MGREHRPALIVKLVPASVALLCAVLLVAWQPVPPPAADLAACPSPPCGQGLSPPCGRTVATLAPARSAGVLRRREGLSPPCGRGPWLYLRGGQPLAPGEELAEVVLVGDLMPGRGVAAVDEPLAEAAPWLRAADLAVGNLECVLDAEDDAAPHLPERAVPGGPYRLRAPASAAAMLADAGFDVLGLANNHALDDGPEALSATAALLGQAGVDPVGAGPGPVAALRPVVHEVRGLRLAFLAFNAVLGPDGVHRGGPLHSAFLDPEGAPRTRRALRDHVRFAPGCQDLLPAGDAWAPATWDATTDGAVAASVAAAREDADAVVVMVHWGYEYDRRSDPAQRAMAQMLLDAGADLVVGHHPHVVQEVESRSAAERTPAPAPQVQAATGAEPGPTASGQAERQGLVAYSLGNLLFDQEQGETRHGLALRAFFDREGLRAVQGLPVQAGRRPRLADPARSASLRDPVPLPPSSQMAGPISSPRPPGRPTPLRFAPGPCPLRSGMPGPLGAATAPLRWRGLFLPGEGQRVEAGGEIDLTGDGVPEEVRLQGEQVVVYEAGVEVWRGLPEWRVVDVALGDPNDDGRAEIVLALWKADRGGEPRSHPFVVGYRGGAYRVLWGGSALPRPIDEVALGDLDGDGVEELLVLEEQDQAGGERAVAAWRWHGWGFSLLWRGTPGPYQDLALLPRTGGAPPRVVVELRP